MYLCVPIYRYSNSIYDVSEASKPVLMICVDKQYSIFLGWYSCIMVPLVCLSDACTVRYIRLWDVMYCTGQDEVWNFVTKCQ